MLCYNITIDQVFILLLFKPTHLVFERIAFIVTDKSRFYSDGQVPMIGNLGYQYEFVPKHKHPDPY
ncbi:hypothetical protein CVD09_08325 [Acinetobacter seifertii]|nr:hypothetical protein CVD09_08325 [Acinetobacter seifertii]